MLSALLRKRRSAFGSAEHSVRIFPMEVRDKGAELALQEWSHWSKYWRVHLVIFGLAVLFALMIDGSEMLDIIISAMAGISAFLRQLADINGRKTYSFIAALGVIVPIVLLAPKAKGVGILDIILWTSIVGLTISLLHGIVGKYLYPKD